MMTKEFSKLNNLLGWLVWAIASVAYCMTIEPTASFWDCGEYIACAFKLEVGHPPGAPFFLIIGRFFTLFAGNDPANAAMMVNVMSALSTSFTVLFLFWTITRLGIRVYGKTSADLTKGQQWAVLGASIVGSLACTFTDTFWFSAVEGEVYAMSSLFTAIVFWAILKWDEEDTVNPAGAMRWLVLISYLIGISIGVHLLSLLAIPAICFIVYFKKYSFSWKGFVIAGIISVFLLGFVQNLIIPKVVKFVADYEVFFTNKLHLGFSTGTIFYFALLIISLTTFIMYTVRKDEKLYKIGLYSAIVLSVFAIIAAPGASGKFLRLITLGGILYAINQYKTKTVTLNAIFLSFATMLIGYSTFFILVIRSQANPPMDENDPENAPNMLSYLLREQYGDWPILYGQYYNAPSRPRSEYGSGDPIYAKDKVNENYKVIDSRKNSIPTYEKEFSTIFPRMYSSQSHHKSGYQYWGNVDEHHRTITARGNDDEPSSVEIPTFAANMTYFMRYQVGYMYLRYFAWNFIGRQNDVQGSTGNNMEGNWITGIQAIDDFRLDYDTSEPIYRDKNNFAHNSYYALPFLLGLLGMYFHYKRHRNYAWVVLAFFLLTGLAIVVFLNQTPYQPRERDYAYPGSFYAFAIWIGFGVLFIYDLLSKKTQGTGIAVASTIIGLIVPALMAAQNWDDHDRSMRTLSRDCAIDYLQSCAPNAILFTNGDNDTFPLWYAQEVEGIRTDVRVVNLSLLQTDWYIKQMRRAAYDSPPVPFTIPEEKLEAEKLSYLIVDSRETKAMNLKKALEFATSDDPNTKFENGGDLLDVLPVGNLYIPVDSMQVMRKKVISVKDTARLVKRISIDISDRRYITKNDVLVLDLVANNNWERPIYFAVTTGDDAYVGLKRYFQLEGLAYRLVPIRQTEMEEAQGGRVATDIMYDNIMNKFLWGGMDKPGINMDENCTRMTSNLRMQMSILANSLINEGKKSKAEKVLDKSLEVMPDANVPFDATVFTMVGAYYDLGRKEKANKLARKLFEIFEHDLRIYNTQKPMRRAAYSREMAQCKELLKRLTGLAQQYHEDVLAKEFMDRLGNLLSPEELMPAEPQLK